MNFPLFLEVVSTLSGVAYVLLVVYQKRSAWLLGILSTGIAMYLFYTSQLYSETLLYSYYVLAGAYAWVHWGTDMESIAVTDIGFGVAAVYALLGIVGAGLLGFFFSKHTQAHYPFFDALTTVFSFVATWFTARKWLMNWLWWIVIDLASAVLYALKDLYLLSGLMIVYAIIAVFGYYQWKRQVVTS